ncbi:PDR/VanB family oxidoreductase [Leucobacter luti]|uniref:PDR/VanB family oxidoreductase n=1 Tax=Leucobacter luti TaxID=340320 RepID=UPI001C68810D|nr:PDR/VanB family oxidoreductase [Leucobacter luti]QYM75825.1 PDR/VanB family oxidoreductase [Leucobacter luti]
MPATLLSSTLTVPTQLLRVTAVQEIAPGIRSFEFSAADGSELPEWTPGAHVDVHLPSGKIRQYSLCGDPEHRSVYRIAVLEVCEGRGGSAEMHRAVAAGGELRLGIPRNDFPVVPAPAYVFVAGGIGITPILAMIREVAAAGRPWKLVYGARSEAHLAFRAELDSLAATSWGMITYVPQDTAGHMDLSQIVRDSAGQSVYCCGPGPLMDALGSEMRAQGRHTELRLERFSADPVQLREGTESFRVELSESGLTVDVTPGTSVLEAIRAAGVAVASSCEMGICGTCETRVIAGEIEHHDSILTEAERAAGNVMMICVSRASSAGLVLAR